MSSAQNLLSRRDVLKRLLQAGLTGAGMLAFTGYSSNSTSPKSPVTLSWSSNDDNFQTFPTLAQYFSQINPYGIQINHSRAVSYDDLVEKFQNKSSKYDIVSLDITWVREFISHGWLEPLDGYWPLNSDQPKRSDYLQKPLEICTLDGKIWAAPLHTDVGILYYRTDFPKNLISLPDVNTWAWDGLSSFAQQAQESQLSSGGFLWEGLWTPSKPTEGLICTFLEILDGFGGQLFDDASNPRQVVVYSSETINALKQMKIWNSTISSDINQGGLRLKASDNNSQDCEKTWRAGHAASMRNWPGLISISDDAQYQVAEKYDIVHLPRRVSTALDTQKSTASPYTRSCLGGWQLAINKYSPHKDEAWQFIKWMLGTEPQKYIAYNESYPVTLQSIYDDPYINSHNNHYKSLLDIIKHAQYRPLLPNYQQKLADPVQRIVTDLLTIDKYTPEKAASNLEIALSQAIPK